MPIPCLALVKRDLVCEGRRRRTWAARVLFVGFLLVIVLPIRHFDPSALNGPGFLGTMERVEFLGDFLRPLLHALLVYAALTIPAYAGNAIVSEKQRGTYDLMYLSLMRPSGIAFGKLVCSLRRLAFLILLSLPATAIALSFVPEFWYVAVVGYAAVGSWALSLASACLLCSSAFRKPGNALGGSCIAMMILSGIPFYALVWLRNSMFGPVYFDSPQSNNIVLALMATFNPFAQIEAVCNGFSPLEFAALLALNAVVCSVCFACTVGFLRRAPHPVQRAALSTSVQPDVAEKRRARSLQAFFMRRTEAPPIADGLNPVFVSELRRGLWGNPRVALAACAGIFALASALSFCGIYFTEDRPALAVSLWLVLLLMPLVVVLLAPTRTAGLLTNEGERHTFDMLRLSGMRPREIVLGKFGAAAVATGAILVLICLSIIPLVFWRVRRWDLLFTGFVSLCVAAYTALAVGLLASALCKTTRCAAVCSVCLNLFICGGILPWLISILFQVDFFVDLANPDKPSLGAFLSPLTAFLTNAGLHLDDAAFGREGSMITPFWIANVVVFALFGSALLAAAVRVFARFRMRAR
ncbi:MAG TPA: ABC transporter permease [Candidatus Hydrogenedentes bacterium]|nr:ABC transporter permease [Candidatus Hydrogenedentota bacterium]HIJ72667.1 ABC transporter permease [Candidatus Hydrogenedentota bacterium]